VEGWDAVGDAAGNTLGSAAIELPLRQAKPISVHRVLQDL